MEGAQLAAAEDLVEFVRGAKSGHGFGRRAVRLLRERQVPEEGWGEEEVELWLRQVSLLDANTYAAGVGEREGRLFAALVARRCWRMAHGVGRSGSLAAPQPKAAGSSLLAALGSPLSAHMLRLAGDPLATAHDTLVLPVATGMGIFFSLATLRPSRPPGADRVLWIRCDQSSAPKAVELAGLVLVPVPLRLQHQSLVTDMAAIEEAIEAQGGADKIVCILSTTSCFAPRVPDDIEAIGRLCAARNIGHIVNNAYGTQSRAIMKLIARTRRVGRLDAYIQSTDKNYCVPVGGSVVCGPLAQKVGAAYPGRASSQPLMDLLITFLTMGVSGYIKLLDEREVLMEWFRGRLQQIPGLKWLDTSLNPISMAFALDPAFGSMVGSMLFTRGVTGHRVCVRSSKSTIKAGAEIRNWGQHVDVYEPCETYINFAVAIMSTKDELERAAKATEKTLREAQKRLEKGKKV